MTAGKYCNRDVVITEPNTTINETAKLTCQYHAGDLVVVKKQGEENIPVGIVTDRDLVIEVLAQEVTSDSMTIKDVVNRDLVTASEGETLRYLRGIYGTAGSQSHGRRRAGREGRSRRPRDAD